MATRKPAAGKAAQKNTPRAADHPPGERKAAEVRFHIAPETAKLLEAVAAHRGQSPAEVVQWIVERGLETEKVFLVPKDREKLLALRGVGKEMWEQIDIDAELEADRESWNDPPRR